MAELKTATNSDQSLPSEIFGLKVENHQLLHASLRTFYANQCTANAKTLKRGQVRGGGKKPWSQKGTGRARAGSIRSPIWRGGGITFGPTGSENYRLKIPGKAKKLALRQALSLQAQAGAIKVVETFACPQGKVSEGKKFLNDHKAQGNSLLIVSVKDELMVRATSNIPQLVVLQADHLNVKEILRADTILLTKKSIEIIKNQFLARAAESAPPQTKVTAKATS